MSMKYNDPIGGTDSSISPQLRDYVYKKRALIEAKKEQYFQPMADPMAMPKHMGKTIKQYVYIPLLDDANINDQGLDATGAQYANGNLYGSSKDIGSIPNKYPVVSETGGRVNRVGFTRKIIEGTMKKFGMFREYTEESVDFDTDDQLMMHINREMLYGASEVTEDMLQIDLLNNAGVVRYTGAATAMNQIVDNEVTYDDLLKLHIDLNNNRVPQKNKMLTGTRLTDTRTISGGRPMYIGSELQPMFERMKNLHNEPAFIPTHQYAANGTVMNGEIGTCGYFRIIVVPEMLHHAGAGGGAVAGWNSTAGQMNVYPMLVIGDGSFTTIGFQTNGQSAKFRIINKKPGKGIADYRDPYGQTGFMSILWWYGFMLLRGERLAVVWTAAQL